VETVRVDTDRGLTKVLGKPTEDSFPHAVCRLSARAYMEAVGMPARGCRNDVVRAEAIIRVALDGRPGLAEAFTV
jgi:hypothetical protein